MDPNSVKKLLNKLSKTQEQEITCDECFDVLDVFAEMAAQGEDPSRYMPLVQQHLDMCSDCEQEFRALMEVLKRRNDRFTD